MLILVAFDHVGGRRLRAVEALAGRQDRGELVLRNVDIHVWGIGSRDAQASAISGRYNANTKLAHIANRRPTRLAGQPTTCL